VADPAYISGTASTAGAAPIVNLIQEAAAVATAHFNELPDGEPGSVYVTLNSSTGYGVIALGMWLFQRDAAGTVTLAGAEPEANGG
jgi:hypothetical protein